MLTAETRQALLGIARAALGSLASGRPPAVPDLEGLPDASGVFVTIRLRGTLRGCLGTLHVRHGLAQEVARCTVESATEDPRFPPVAPGELPDLSLEISVLGPLEPIAPSPDAFTIGLHGLVVEDGARRGLLLPQVANEWGWTPEQFLSQTCVKAGLEPAAWRQGAQVYRFSADVFGESP